MGDLVRIELIFHCLCKTGKGRERLRDMEKFPTERRVSLLVGSKYGMSVCPFGQSYCLSVEEKRKKIFLHSVSHFLYP